jgi:hypothetical protein
MKRQILTIAAAGIFAMTFASQAHADAVSPAFEYTSDSPLTDSRPFTLGFQFSLSGPTTVGALGYNTLNFTQDEQVGIWDSVGNLLASVTLLTSDPVTGHFAYHSIPSLLLDAGTYTIGGTYQSGLFPSGAIGVTTAPGFTWLRDEQILGSGLNDPTGSFGGYGQNGIGLVNFAASISGAVPEPGTWLTMILGLGLVGAYMRRRQKVAVSWA